MDKQIKVKNIPVEVKIQKPDLSRQDDRFNPRNRIYVRAVKGLHQLLRQRIGFLGMLAFMVLPWINFNGQQAVLFDLIEFRPSILTTLKLEGTFISLYSTPSSLSSCSILLFF